MEADRLRKHLDGLPIPHVRYFDSIGSTNDEALRWAAEERCDGCLVVADQQTAGRGRFDRKWITRPGAALAFSLILSPSTEERQNLAFFSPLGALGICKALEDSLSLTPVIKWPNDVLLGGQKAAGILVEAAWMGDQLQAIVIGIGINVSADAVPQAEELLFPATSVEQAAGRTVDRWDLLHSILGGIFIWRSNLAKPAFYEAWQNRLAFKGERVRIEETAGQKTITGELIGLAPSGDLLLRDDNGAIIPVQVGDIHLRLLD